jgi:hypothetical protein
MHILTRTSRQRIAPPPTHPTHPNVRTVPTTPLAMADMATSSLARYTWLAAPCAALRAAPLIAACPVSDDTTAVPTSAPAFLRDAPDMR